MGMLSFWGVSKWSAARQACVQSPPRSERERELPGSSLRVCESPIQGVLARSAAGAGVGGGLSCAAKRGGKSGEKGEMNTIPCLSNNSKVVSPLLQSWYSSPERPSRLCVLPGRVEGCRRSTGSPRVKKWRALTAIKEWNEFITIVLVRRICVSSPLCCVANSRSITSPTPKNPAATSSGAYI